MAIQEVKINRITKNLKKEKKEKNQHAQQTAKILDCLQIKEKAEQLRDFMHSKRLTPETPQTTNC